ncbi:hypothetical protein Q9L58_006668 [Maublancomyces gigas]|uniref:Uncharacterized protein n=1 Tax=Discina gigas TaxID=1032678 RepID=A0ABR3GF63_9PEZI
MAPFHAADDHSRRATRNTLSRAISSYIPTIKAQSYAREKKLDLSNPDMRLLLVTMSTTPSTPAILAKYGASVTPGYLAKNWKPLNNAIKEVKEIMEVVKDKSTQLGSPSVADAE